MKEEQVTYSFNLIDQPWIPCLALDAGPPRDVSLRDALVRAHELREIAGASPPVTLSLHRLLLAVLHRVFGPADAAEWNALWSAGSFDPVRIDAYLDRWYDRFDLFDATHPFYQAASLDFRYAGPASKLSHEINSGNNALLFDHTADDQPARMTPAEAARRLVAHQNLALGGFLSYEDGQDPKLFKSAKSALLVNAAVFLAQGEHLRETLLLNLHRYNTVDGAPFAGIGVDTPAWERDTETPPAVRQPAGYLDLLTWQSRRVRLQAETAADGSCFVRHAVIMKGESFPDDYDLHNKEPMMAFQKRMTAKDGDPWPALGFVEERALWRDSVTVLQAASHRHDRPRILTWLGDVELKTSQRLNLHALGLSSDRATPEFWRHERLPLPQAYLHDDKELFDQLRDAVDVAEDAGRLLGAGGPLARCAEQLGITDREEVRKFIASRGAGRHYWSAIDLPFRSLMEQLPGDAGTDAYGERTYGATQRPRWADAVRQAAWAAFRAGVDGLYTSPRGIKAVAIAERDFTWRLSKVMSAHTAQEEEVTI
jgi:CRISPR system Cascade subunit CasA